MFLYDFPCSGWMVQRRRNFERGAFRTPQQRVANGVTDVEASLWRWSGSSQQSALRCWRARRSVVPQQH